MLDKVEVVNRDDERRPPRRQDQGMHRMGDVERCAGDRFGRGPVEAMPGEIQQRHWNAAVHERGAAEIAVGYQTILPRAREQDQFERAAIGRERDKRARQPVRVFADAGPLAQRRPVIEEDAHLCKSFRASILL